MTTANAIHDTLVSPHTHMQAVLAPTFLRVPFLRHLVLVRHSEVRKGNADLKQVRPWIHVPDGPQLTDQDVRQCCRHINVQNRQLDPFGGYDSEFDDSEDEFGGYGGGGYGSGRSSSSMFGFGGGMLGFSGGECDELAMQGVKPWDDDAADVLGVLNGDW